MTTTETLRNRIVQALEAGKDTSSLEKQLRAARAAEAEKAELASLRALAERHKGWRSQAAAIHEKAEKQLVAVTAFLEARDKVLAEFDKVIDQVKDLQPVLQEAGAQYARQERFWGDIKRIPRGYLAADFKLAMLGNSADPSPEVVQTTLHFMSIARQILAGAERVDIAPCAYMETPKDELQEVPVEEVSCPICEHPELDAVDDNR